MKRDELMHKIQETGFAVYDTVLFLDSHPTCRMALDFYNDNKRMYENYVAEYEKNFGPLTVGGQPADADSWTWIQGPWPWELEA